MIELNLTNSVSKASKLRGTRFSGICLRIIGDGRFVIDNYTDGWTMDYIDKDGNKTSHLATFGTLTDCLSAVTKFVYNQEVKEIKKDLENHTADEVLVNPIAADKKEEVKPTNPKDALGIKKAPLSTLPTGPMYEVALAMLEGARKYGRHNYRVMGVKASVYYDAAMGHITSWWEGEDFDSASGLHHLAKAMACLAVMRDSMMMENWIDDRPPRYPTNPSELMRNNSATDTILEKYPDCIEPYTEKNKEKSESANS